VFFKNPLPVAVVLLPLAGSKILAVRRAIPPHVGQLALPGGYVDWGETWQEAAAREVREETGIEIRPDALQLLEVTSVPNGHLLVFAVGPVIQGFQQFSNPEVQELVALDGPAPLAFEAHTHALRRYFEK
jgi:ADP-ribose pyrophosphatase YjhB (NUDIX family)